MATSIERTAIDLRLAIGRIARRIRQIYATSNSAGDESFIEISVLSRLDQRGPLTSRSLAEIESVSPQAIGTALGGLEQRCLVVRTPHPDDGRKVISTITKAGRAALASREHAVNQRLTRALSDSFDADERRQIANAIPLLERLSEEL
jgi:DNA-binding MarR family transcriptional regulator